MASQIGTWSEIRLEIIGKYAKAYSTILSKQDRLHHVYIDAFAGPGEHVSRTTGEIVHGSPVNALSVHPPFREYYFVDLDPEKVDRLRKHTGDRPNVHVLHGDCNQVLLRNIFPRIQYSQYRRALCILDPYNIGIDWEVVAAAGQLKTIEIFLSFMVSDMNRNVLWRNPEHVSQGQIERMNRFWGDESWKDVVYSSPQLKLFDGVPDKQPGNEAIVLAYRERLRHVGGFSCVPEPIAMTTSSRAVIYYLFFAAQKPVAQSIVSDIFSRYRV